MIRMSCNGSEVSSSPSGSSSGGEVFVQTLNPMRGRMEWKAQPGDYDYKQEVARAAFADMLHDSERVSDITCTQDFKRQ